MRFKVGRQIVADEDWISFVVQPVQVGSVDSPEMIVCINDGHVEPGPVVRVVVQSLPAQARSVCSMAIKTRSRVPRTGAKQFRVKTSGVKAKGDLNLDRVRAVLSGPGVIGVNFLNDAERIQNARY